jgi:hypothetical protein
MGTIRSEVRTDFVPMFSPTPPITIGTDFGRVSGV